jgi:hypothetical protein
MNWSINRHVAHVFSSIKNLLGMRLDIDSKPQTLVFLIIIFVIERVSALEERVADEGGLLTRCI